jgi:hypothetical protein
VCCFLFSFPFFFGGAGRWRGRRSSHLRRTGLQPSVEQKLRVVAHVGHAHGVAIAAARRGGLGCGRDVYDLVPFRRELSKGARPAPLGEHNHPREERDDEEEEEEEEGRAQRRRRHSYRAAGFRTTRAAVGFVAACEKVKRRKFGFKNTKLFLKVLALFFSKWLGWAWGWDSNKDIRGSNPNKYYGSNPDKPIFVQLATGQVFLKAKT